MKRPLVPVLISLLILASAVLSITALAAPVAQETRPVIVQPAQDSPVRGVVQIVGSAVDPQFQRYELYYAPWPVPSDQSWIFIGDAHFSQQPLGLLGTWDSRSVTDGAYALRVRVVKEDGNYQDSDPRRVLVANTRPVESPTPAATDTPEPLPTEPPATPTIVVAVPTTVVKLTAAPTPVPESRTTPILPAGQATVTGQPGASASGSVTDQFFNGQRLLGTAKKAAFYTAAAFVIIGLFFGVKALLVWLWQKIRP
jgi:hypothetical protein